MAYNILYDKRDLKTELLNKYNCLIKAISAHVASERPIKTEDNGVLNTPILLTSCLGRNVLNAHTEAYKSAFLALVQ